MKVEIISSSIIKPSSATPSNLKTYKLLLIDQNVSPEIYMSLVYFYEVHSTDHCINYRKTVERMRRLQAALSDNLARFFPLAGRFCKDSCVVECNDQGVDYLEARVSARLSDVLESPEDGFLQKLIPSETEGLVSEGCEALVRAQVNVFDCGGLAIGISVSHGITDMCTIGNFVNSWAAITRAESAKVACPTFDCSSLFPPKETLKLPTFVKCSFPKIMTRRLIFDASSITALRNKAASSIYPTRVEALIALILKCNMSVRAASKPESLSGTSVVTLAMNLRRRMVPPLPDHSFGNLAAVQISQVKKGSDLQELVIPIHDMINEVSSDYIEKARRGTESANGGQSFLDPLMQRLSPFVENGDLEINLFSSWCRFDLYDADFGWGEPAWVANALSPNLACRNLVYLMDTKDGKGIEIWLYLAEEEMAMFEQDRELLEFVSSIKRV